MLRKIEFLTERITAVLASWPSVDSVLSMNPSETDAIDPYFALVFDVYYDGEIPSSDERQAMYDNPGAFESSAVVEKDRFFLDGLPIRIEFKKVKILEDFVRNGYDARWAFGTVGTYVIYRVVNGKILFKRTDRLERVRAALKNCPDAFWLRIREAQQSKMEHCLSDLGGAAMKDDRYFYFISLAGFMRACVSALFAINRRFEPSDRQMADSLAELPVLPEDFSGRWSNLLRTDDSVYPQKRYQIAQLITRDVLALE